MARAKQGALPGMAQETIQEIEEAADFYVEARNAWQRAKAPMDERYAILEAAMKKHKKKVYDYDGKKVVAGDPRIKVLTKKEATEEEADGD